MSVPKGASDAEADSVFGGTFRRILIAAAALLMATIWFIVFSHRTPESTQYFPVQPLLQEFNQIARQTRTLQIGELTTVQKPGITMVQGKFSSEMPTDSTTDVYKAAFEASNWKNAGRRSFGDSWIDSYCKDGMRANVQPDLTANPTVGTFSFSITRGVIATAECP